MSPRFARGLVVGKFAPLHRGHELLIQTAEQQCSKLFIISYSKPELAGCEPQKRAHWLSVRFPRAHRLVLTDSLLGARLPGVEIPPNDAPELIHRRFVGLLCETFFGVTVDAVFTSEDYGAGFARDLGEYFRENAPEAPPVEHVMVDRERLQIPICGTAIRGDLQGEHRWLAPEIYASFQHRICLLGGESSGKSTLAELLAREQRGAAVGEYGRELWELRKGKLQPGDMLEIAREQIAREQRALDDGFRWVFCDTSPLTTLFYSHHLFGSAPAELEELARRPYSLSILCAPDFAFVQDGTRVDEAFRRRQDAWYRQQLARMEVPWLDATGTPAKRLATVGEALEIQAMQPVACQFKARSNSRFAQ